MTAIFTLLTSFAASMMDIWQEVITFLTTTGNEIALVGLIAWLFVMATGGILRLVKN